MACLRYLALAVCLSTTLVAASAKHDVSTSQITRPNPRISYGKRNKRESSLFNLPNNNTPPRLRKLEDAAYNDDAAYNYNDDGDEIDDDDENKNDYDDVDYDDKFRAYEKQAEQTYWDMFQESPANWTNMQWYAFAALFLLASSCCCCICWCCVIPRICRRRTVEIYSASLLV